GQALGQGQEHVLCRIVHGGLGHPETAQRPPHQREMPCDQQCQALLLLRAGVEATSSTLPESERNSTGAVGQGVRHLENRDPVILSCRGFEDSIPQGSRIAVVSDNPTDKRGTW